MEIKTQKSGKYAMNLIKNLYCSCVSETSMFLMFNYHFLLSKDKKQKHIFNSFLKTTQKKLRVLGKLLIEKNCLPFYLNSQNFPLTALWLQPTFEKSKFLKIDKLLLKNLATKYEHAILKTSDKKTLKILLKLKQKTVGMISKLKVV